MNGKTEQGQRCETRLKCLEGPGRIFRRGHVGRHLSVQEGSTKGECRDREVGSWEFDWLEGKNQFGEVKGMDFGNCSSGEEA